VQVARLPTAFLLLDCYCHSVFSRNAAFPEEARELRELFFRALVEVKPGDPMVALYKDFSFSLHTLFGAHMALFNRAAQEVGSGYCLGKMSSIHGRPNSGADGWTLQVDRLTRRTPEEEDGYCRYLCSFGLGLPFLLSEMTTPELGEWTVG